MQWRPSGDGGASDMAGSVGGVSDTAPSGPEPSGSIVSGTIFAGYRIESEIGRGGMGVVYRARHLALDRECALKLISPALSNDPRFRERFQREVPAGGVAGASERRVRSTTPETRAASSTWRCAWLREATCAGSWRPRDRSTPGGRRDCSAASQPGSTPPMNAA